MNDGLNWEVRSLITMMNQLFPPHPSIKAGTLLEAKPEVTPMGQTFYPEHAYALFPRGCQCPDRSGSCDWCRCYYNGPEYAIATSPIEV